MNEEDFEKNRERVLNGITGFRLFDEFANNQNDDSWGNFESFIEDLDGKDFEFSMSMLSLTMVLLTQMSIITRTTPDEILSLIGQGASLTTYEDFRRDNDQD